MSTLPETHEYIRRRKRRVEIGKRLLAARKAKRLTQVALAKRMNISAVTVGTVEMGKIKLEHILDTHVTMFCAALEIDVAQIMTNLP